MSGLFALAMLATIACEIAKDIEDIDGDSAMGLDTPPIRIGSRRAGYAASAFGLIAVLLSPVPYLSLGFSVLVSRRDNVRESLFPDCDTAIGEGGCRGFVETV